MSKILPYQQRFKLFVTPSDKGNKVDVTDFCSGNVTFEIEVMKLCHLTFNVFNADMHTDWLKTPYIVEFWGGYIGSENFYKNQSSLIPPTAGAILYLLESLNIDGMECCKRT